MPTLTVRSVGMSYLIAGLPDSGLDAPALLAAMDDRFGEAVGPMGAPIEALIVDRSVIAWENLMDWLVAWLRTQGRLDASWMDRTTPQGHAATIHFQP